MNGRVLFIALGGTIAMTATSEGGIAPSLSAQDLVAAVPGLEQLANIAARSPFQLPGASLTIAHLVEIAELIATEAREGIVGAVVVQGTDTIEETAFLLDCMLQLDIPVIVTGAMRGAQALGADGPANLMASAIVAVSKEARGLGVLVVLNDEVHAARHVRKQHTSLLSAFSSAPHGLAGQVIEGVFRPGMKPRALLHIAAPQLPADIPPVALVEIGLGEDGRMLGLLAKAGYRGAVLAAMGAGHVPQAMVESIARLMKEMPVVLSTRVMAGPVFHATYGFAGSEIDLRARGILGGGELGPLKARLLLQLALLAGQSPAQIHQTFAQIDKVAVSAALVTRQEAVISSRKG